MIRTTSDGAGHPHGIATGLGATPEVALSALQGQAQAQAEQAAASYDRATARHERPGAQGEPGKVVREPRGGLVQELRFEVVHVRLAPALLAGGENGWLAYGTVVSATGTAAAAVGDGWTGFTYHVDLARR
jgi:hypothetical protein